MSANPPIPKVINILIALGIAVPFMIAVGGTYLTLYIMQQQPGSKGEPQIPIGELGSFCGGLDRRPCKPGLVCHTTSVGDYGPIGECVTDTRTVYPPGNQGDVCDSERGCSPGLLCDRKGHATGTCMTFATSTVPIRH